MKYRFFTCLVLLITATVSAEVLNVPGTDYPSIQAAINGANHGDAIIVSPGTYNENINFLGKAITLRSTDPNDPNIVHATIIDGNEPDDPNFASVVTFNGGEDHNSVLSGFTMTGGTGTWIPVSWQFKGLRWNRCGGGVVCYNMSAPTIINNVFAENTAGQGGGVYVYGDPGNPSDPNEPVDPPVHLKPVISNNTFLNNTAVTEHGFEPPNSNYPANDHGDGGAIVTFQGVDAVINDNTMHHNHADYYGGAIHVRQWSHGSIENNHIYSNDSTLGAGLHITYNAAPTIRLNRIERNIAGPGGGGGIYIYNDSYPLIERNTIFANECVNGSGMAVFYESFPIIRSNLIVKNKLGSAIRVRGQSNPTIINNTVADNIMTSDNAGIDCTYDSNPLITNNIIASNTDGYGIIAEFNCSPVVTYNNIWKHDAGNYGLEIADQTGINGNISVEPDFASSDINDYTLKISSPCINSGDPTFIADINETDLNGDSRILGQCVDLGADETWPVQNITSGNHHESIQSAIDDANQFDTILVAKGRYYENINLNAKNITLRSSDPNDDKTVSVTIIDGNNADTVVTINSGEDANCILTGFTITNGNTTAYGAGIAIADASPQITKNNIHSNKAENGGGIHILGSSAQIINNKIFNNVAATSAGGIWVGLCNPAFDPVIAGNIIAGNTAPSAGGITISSASPIITNNTLIHNRSYNPGTAVLGNGQTIYNCIIKDNVNLSNPNEPSTVDQCLTAYCCLDEMMAGNGNVYDDPCLVNSGYWNDMNTPADINDDVFILGNYHIPPESPCFNSGDINAVPSILTLDLDYEPRIYSDTVDIGADEVILNPYDLNNDGIVDYIEIKKLGEEWLLNGPELQTDYYPDNVIDLLDAAMLFKKWRWKAVWYK